LLRTVEPQVIKKKKQLATLDKLSTLIDAAIEMDDGEEKLIKWLKD